MRITVILLLVVSLMLTACGRRGALIYPDMLLPAAPKAVTAHQTGQVVRLSMELSRKELSGRDLPNLGGVIVFRRASLAGQGPECPTCTEDYVLYRKLYLEPETTDPNVQRFGNLLVMLDGEVRAGDEYRYQVRQFSKDGVEGALSEPVTVHVTSPLPPPALTALPEIMEILLRFEAPEPAVGSPVGYNVYRAPKGKPLPWRPINGEPVAAKAYLDSGMDRTLTYVYVVRTVVKLPSGELLESEPSNQVEAQLRLE